MDDDLASDWLEHESFRVLSGDYEECPVCWMGILHSVATESGSEPWCDRCAPHFVEA